jgi:DNA primase
MLKKQMLCGLLFYFFVEKCVMDSFNKRLMFIIFDFFINMREFVMGLKKEKQVKYIGL